jgi:hypothetical protein
MPALQASCGSRAISGLSIKRSAVRLAVPLPAVPRRLASARCHASLLPQRAQLVAAGAALAAAMRDSHVCGSMKQSARDALDALDGAKARR